MSMESLPFLGFRVLGVDTKNSNPKFTGKYQVFHYTFLFNAYLVSFIGEKREQIGALEKERQSVYNRNRHKKSGALNAQAREISARIKPLRAELSIAKAALKKIPKLKEVIEAERQAETAVITKNRERRHAR